MSLEQPLSAGGLTALGWSEAWADVFAPYAAEGLVPGRVTAEHPRVYRVRTEAGESLARVSGRFRHEARRRADYPVVGDWVALAPVRDTGHATIHAVLPRRTRFVRRLPGRRAAEQVVAANVDTVFIVSGLDGEFQPRRLERYLILARESGATPVVVLNKADLCDALVARVAEAERVAGGAPVLAVSARSGENLEALRAFVRPGETVACLGASGVGKSTLINRLAGEAWLPTGEVDPRRGYGRHTSTVRQLVVLPGGGLVIDTPGMRELQLWEAGEALAETFADIYALAAGCRFTDCRHREEPGCAVRQAVAEGRVSPDRLASYHTLVDELAAETARAARRGRPARS